MAAASAELILGVLALALSVRTAGTLSCHRAHVLLICRRPPGQNSALITALCLR
jgi:hypothetical protein